MITLFMYIIKINPSIDRLRRQKTNIKGDKKQINVAMLQAQLKNGYFQFLHMLSPGKSVQSKHAFFTDKRIYDLP